MTVPVASLGNLISIGTSPEDPSKGGMTTDESLFLSVELVWEVLFSKVEFESVLFESLVFSKTVN